MGFEGDDKYGSREIDVGHLVLYIKISQSLSLVPLLRYCDE